MAADPHARVGGKDARPRSTQARAPGEVRGDRRARSLPGRARRTRDGSRQCIQERTVATAIEVVGRVVAEVMRSTCGVHSVDRRSRTRWVAVSRTAIVAINRQPSAPGRWTSDADLAPTRTSAPATCTASRARRARGCAVLHAIGEARLLRIRIVELS